MAEKKEESKDKKDKGDEAPAAPSAPKGPMIVALLNTVAVLAGVGVIVYTKIMFKRPPITESKQRAVVEELKTKPLPTDKVTFMHFEPVNVNLKTQAAAAEDAQGGDNVSALQHFANFGFSLEIMDTRQLDELERLRPIILDRVLTMIGRKSYEELVSVQGRYLLRTEISEMINRMFNASRTVKTTVVSNVFLSTFIVQ